jgi:hypothetical protein
MRQSVSWVNAPYTHTPSQPQLCHVRRKLDALTIPIEQPRRDVLKTKAILLNEQTDIKPIVLFGELKIYTGSE